MFSGKISQEDGKIGKDCLDFKTKSSCFPAFLFNFNVVVVFLLPFQFSVASELYKWTDRAGNLHATDRIENVPQPYRRRLRKQMRAKKSATQPATLPASHPMVSATQPSTEISSSTGYERYLVRLAIERSYRERAQTLRNMSKQISDELLALDEREGELKSNPKLNVAIPERQNELNEIEAQRKKLQTEMCPSKNFSAIYST